MVGEETLQQLPGSSFHFSGDAHLFVEACCGWALSSNCVAKIGLKLCDRFRRKQISALRACSSA